MSVFYNDNDSFCVRVLEQNIRRGFLPGGTVDGRDIREVKPEDVSGSGQAHFFAGIGGFPLGLRLAGVPESLSLWTAGDPCQGNSKAGGVWKKEHEDVATQFLELARANRPELILRENPSDGREDSIWTWRRYRDALSSLGYSVIPFRIRACTVGATHRGDRVFLLAARSTADSIRLERLHGERLSERELLRICGYPRGGAGENRLPESRICGSGNGIPNRVDRTRALGNTVDPRMVRIIGNSIMEGIYGQSEENPD